MSGLPQSYQSPMHLPFNRACLDGQLCLQGPTDDPGQHGFALILSGTEILVKDDGRFTLPPGNEPSAGLYLGLWQGKPCRVIEMSGDMQVPAGTVPMNLFDENPRLPIDLLSLGGMARMILHWHHRSRYCGHCGQATEWVAGEWGKACQSCDNHAYPAVHPCAIVLVRRPGELLLTRKPNWAPNRYSLVAGFQDVGESLEETALREIQEETGVVAGNVQYVGSQCWPFPSQVMVGFVADYLSGEVKVDKTELADARWFSVDDLPQLPPKRSIARYILDTTPGLL